MQGAREIKPSKGKHFRGKTVFLKNSTMVYWESTLERDFVRIADFDPTVLDIQHQPFHLKFSYQGRPYSYYPDYMLTFNNQQIVIAEVKPLKKLNDARNPVKFEVGRRFCAENGWAFRVYTEEEIRPSKYFQTNLKMLRGLGNEQTTLMSLQLVLNTSTEVGPCPILELQSMCKQLTEEEFYKALYKLMYFQIIHADLLQLKLTRSSTVYTDQFVGGF